MQGENVRNPTNKRESGAVRGSFIYCPCLESNSSGRMPISLLYILPDQHAKGKPHNLKLMQLHQTRADGKPDQLCA